VAGCQVYVPVCKDIRQPWYMHDIVTFLFLVPSAFHLSVLSGFPGIFSCGCGNCLHDAHYRLSTYCVRNVNNSITGLSRTQHDVNGKVTAFCYQSIVLPPARHSKSSHTTEKNKGTGLGDELLLSIDFIITPCLHYFNFFIFIYMCRTTFIKEFYDDDNE